MENVNNNEQLSETEPDSFNKDRVKDECLRYLAACGIRPDGNILAIPSGSLGIRKLGKVDFLAKCGYRVFFTKGR